MPRYGINPFTGEVEVVPINNAASGGDSAGANGDRYAIFEQNTPAKEWMIDSQRAYPIPTIYVSKIGDRVFNPAIQVVAKWDYLNPYQIRVQFDVGLCTGYTILHFN